MPRDRSGPKENAAQQTTHRMLIMLGLRKDPAWRPWREQTRAQKAWTVTGYLVAGAIAITVGRLL